MGIDAFPETSIMKSSSLAKKGVLLGIAIGVLINEISVAVSFQIIEHQPHHQKESRTKSLLMN